MQLSKNDVANLNQQPAEYQVGDGGFEYAALFEVFEQAKISSCTLCTDDN